MDFDSSLLKGNVQTMILAILRSDSLHGYGLAKEIELRSREALVFGEGTIYPALRALERQGFIEGQWDTNTSGPPRRVYSLTSSGRAELESRLQTWSRFVNSINLVLEGSRDAVAE